MNTTINQMLKDLYEMDPSLKEHDKELKGILKELMEVRPDVRIDEDFIRTLRQQLDELALSKTKHAVAPGGWLVKLLFSLSGAVMMAILFLTVTYLPMGQSVIFPGGIKTVGKAAFDLGNGSANGASPTALSPRTENAPAVGAVGMGGVGTAIVSDAKMMPPYPDGESVSYRYVYSGQLPVPSDSQMAVYKRLPVSVNDRAFTGALKGFDFGLFDIKAFDDLKAENMSFLEDKEYGYGIQISFTEGVININQNWYKWPNPFNDCTDDACYQRLALKATDVPTDDDAIAMSDMFMKEHGIKLENYGPAKVMNSQPFLYKAAGGVAAEQMPAFVPDYVSLTYPEQVDGKDVTEADGTLAGITVAISVRDKKVTSVNNLRADNFEKSMYDTETDTESLLKWAGRGGVNYWEYTDTTAKVVDVKLGDPTIVYYKFGKWVQSENRNEEYLIPAYSFPIEKSADYQSYRSAILVPLIKGLEDLNPEQGTVPVPVPMTR